MRLRVRSLPLLSGLMIRRYCELWYRLQTRLGSELLWLWCRPVATALIGPLAWEPPYATGAAQKTAKKKKKLTFKNQLHFCILTMKYKKINIKIQYLLKSHPKKLNT